MLKSKINLVQTTAADDLVLNGLYVDGDKTKAACIFIHGYCGDFFGGEFYHTMVDQLADNNRAIVLAQHRGTGVQSEFFRNDGWLGYIGSAYENLDDSHLDISAWVDFMRGQGHAAVVLMGHSVGTIKVSRYLFQGKQAGSVEKLVLLAPFAKNAMLESRSPEVRDAELMKAREMTESGGGGQLAPSPFEDAPMSWTTYYSLFRHDDLGDMWDFHRPNYDFPALQRIGVPTLAILGGNDPYVGYPNLDVSAEQVLGILKAKIPNCETLYLPDGDHSFHGFESEVAASISAFV